jgi:transposase-like protein
VRDRIRAFIEAMLEEELTAALGGRRYQRGESKGRRHGRRERQLLGSFGPVSVSVPRARLAQADGSTREWRSAALPRHARMTRQVEALIAAAYLAGTNTRRVGRALGALFRGAVGKDVVSRTWRRVKADWDAWNQRSLAGEDIVRLILDGTVVRVGWTARRAASRCWWCSASAPRGKRFSCPCATWAARARRPGGRCWTTWSYVG